jgi:D-3-phosphoglycerate dehydrogenase
MASTDKTSYPKEKIRILFLENISDLAVKNFQQQGYSQVQKITKALTEEDLIKRGKGYVHILGYPFLNPDHLAVLEAAKKLQGNRVLLHRVNQVNLRQATSNGVRCSMHSHSNTRSVAELVIGPPLC